MECVYSERKGIHSLWVFPSQANRKNAISIQKPHRKPIRNAIEIRNPIFSRDQPFKPFHYASASP